MGKCINGFDSDFKHWSSIALLMFLWVFYQWARQLSTNDFRGNFCVMVFKLYISGYG